MTCEDFDHLRARAAGRCEMCGLPEGRTGHGQLHIDHDPRRGYWAVRGLLCSHCNTSLGPGESPWSSPRHLKYLAQPWVDERFGAEALTVKPEPPLGSIVSTPGRKPGWERTEQGWRAIRTYRGHTSLTTWAMLNSTYGPHRLTVENPPLMPITAAEQADDPKLQAIDRILAELVAARREVNEARRRYRTALVRAIARGDSQAVLSRKLNRSREMLRRDVELGMREAAAEAHPS